MSKVPIIACVSLYKWSAVMQFNELVLTGMVPALVKAIIQTLQVATAKELTLPTAVWDLVETINLFLGRYLFLPNKKSKKCF